MEEKYLILSDIHGNLSAFSAVLSDCKDVQFSGVILLGDIIDYGMRSNEVIEKLQELSRGEWANKIIVNIWGNHERMIVDGNLARNLERLSSDRGRNMAMFTASHLSDTSVSFIRECLKNEPKEEFEVGGLQCLAVHGSLEDEYWKSIDPNKLCGDYSAYDIVFSGHSHFPHSFTSSYPSDNAEMRNQKTVLFINPGSVGQPRNHNPRAQYAVLSLPSRSVELRAVEYDIEYEQSLYPDEIDEFYKNRLALGV